MRSTLFLFVFLSSILAHTITAQEVQVDKPVEASDTVAKADTPVAKSEGFSRLYPLKFIESEAAMTKLRELGIKGKISLKQRENALLIQVDSQEAFEEIDAIVKSMDSVREVRLFRLEHLGAAAAQEILESLKIDGTFGVDVRQNALLVSANNDDLEKVETVLKVVDVPTPDRDQVTQVRSENLRNVSGGVKLIEKFAELSGVALAGDANSDILILRGTREDVDEVNEFIHEILKSSQKRKMEQSLGQVSYGLRVLWLTNDSEESDSTVPAVSEQDAGLNKAVQKLAELGFPNMKIKMQLVGRSDMSDEHAKCELEGSLPDNSCQLHVQASLKVSEPTAMSGLIRLDAKINSEPPTSSSIQVNINLEPQKYYVLSAAPIGGVQSAYVVQLIENF